MPLDIVHAPTAITIRPESTAQAASPARERRQDVAKSVAEVGPDHDTLWGSDGFTFGDLIDIINPLQHIPVISTMYRQLTQDTISPAARLIGGGLLAGPIGVAAGVMNIAFEQQTRKDIGEAIVSAFTGSSGTEEVQVAYTGSSIGSRRQANAYLTRIYTPSDIVITA